MSEPGAGPAATPAKEERPATPADVCDGCRAIASVVRELCKELLEGVVLHHGAEERVRERLGELAASAERLERAHNFGDLVQT